MHRIDTSTAQTDKFGKGKNGFTNGDPTTGRLATALNSDMWDAVQEEICAVIEGAGVTLDKAKHDQMYQAIVSLITKAVPDALLRTKNLSDVADAAKALANIGGYPSTGGALTNNGAVITLKAKTAGSGVYLLIDDSDGSNLCYLGKGSKDNNDAVFNNYKGGNNSVVLRANGAVDINAQNSQCVNINAPLKAGGTVAASKEISAGYPGPFAWGDQYKTKAPFFNSFATTGASEYHPAIKQLATITDKNSYAFSMGTLVNGTALTWHLHMKGSGAANVDFYWDTNGNFTAPGELIPGSFANFDARYYTQTIANGKFQPKGSYAPAGEAYTKAESDGRFQKINTASKAASGWYKDTNTGMIFQWGTVNRTNYSTPVTFPIAFPSVCVGVSATLRNYINDISSSTFNIRAVNVSRTGFQYGSGGTSESQAFWFAIGY